MKRFLLTGLIAAAGGSLSMGASFDNITWSSGSWGYNSPIVDMTVPAINTVNGMVVGCENLYVPNPYVDEGENPEPAKKITIEGPAGFGTVERNLTKMTADENVQNVFKFTVSSTAAPIRIEGAYKVTFPESCMFADGVGNPEFSVTFYVKDETVYTPVAIDYELNPINGVELEELENVTLSFYSRWMEDQYDGDKLVAREGSERFFSKGINSAKTARFVNKATGEVIECTGRSTSSNYNKLAYLITPAKKLTSKGTYTLEIPEDYIRLEESRGSVDSNVCNEALSYDFIIGVDDVLTTSLKPVPSPAPGEVAAITKFEFNAPEGTKFYIPDVPVSVTLTKPDGSTVQTAPYSNVNVEGDMAFLNFNEVFTAPGEYTLSFPLGCWEFYAGQTAYLSESYELKYTVIETTPVDMAYTANPADGSIVYSLNYVYVTFEQPVSGVAGMTPTVVRPDGSIIDNASLAFNPSLNRLMVDLRFPDQFGHYKVTVPQGAVINENNEVNKEFTLNINYAERAEVEIPFTVSPEEGEVKSLGTILLTVPADYTDVTRVDGGLTRVNFSTQDGSKWIEYIQETSEPNVLRIELAPLSEGSRPELKVGDEVNMILPAQSLRLTNSEGIQVYNDMCVFSWVINDKDAVEQLEWSNAGAFDVYSLDGTQVLSNATLEEVKKLRGVYVVNGKILSL